MRIFSSKTFVVAGWLLFMLCLVLPATTEEEGVVFGYQYAQAAIENIFDDYEGWPFVSLSGLSNIVAALGLIAVVGRSSSFLISLSLLFFVFGVNNSWYYIGGMEDLSVGYFVWVASFFFTSGGLLCLSLKRRPNKSAQPDGYLPQ